MSERKWVVRAKKADFDMLAEKFNIDPVTARIMINRDIPEDEFQDFLHPENAAFHDPFLMENMNQAVRFIIHGIEEGHKMRIISDYDVDGVTSTYILYRGLKRIGADVDYVIPHRIVDGYGISEAIADRVIADGINTVITCDNGISAYNAVSRFKEAGISVVVTDHHDIPCDIVDGEKYYIIPPADAVLDSKKETCKYPYKDLCGAGVAYKLVQALYEKREIPVTELDPFLDFVAVATICDVVPVTGENRTFVVKGLSRLRHSENTGLRALIRVNQLSDAVIESWHIGFRIGPCINASGRLESAMAAMELFLDENGESALEKARELKEINDERKQLTIDGAERAEELVRQMGNDKIYVIYLPDCHESLAGIIAGRIRESFNHPAFVLTDGENPDELKGSGRSMEGYHMADALAECKDILVKHGGHAKAAGLTVRRDNLELLRQRLNENCKLNDDDFVPKVRIDVVMPFAYVTEELVEELESLAPFGEGNEKPVFAQKDVSIVSAKIVGKEQNVVKVTMETRDGFVGEGIYFNAPEFSQNIINWFGQEEYDKVLHGWLNNVVLNVVYYPAINEFNGTRSIQFKISEYSMAAVREVL